MQQIEGVILKELVSQAAKAVLEEKEKGVLSLIKQKLNEFNQKTIKIADLESQLAREKKSAERLQSWLKQVGDGNWEVINLSEKSPESE